MVKKRYSKVKCEKAKKACLRNEMRGYMNPKNLGPMKIHKFKCRCLRKTTVKSACGTARAKASFKRMKCKLTKG